MFKKPPATREQMATKLFNAVLDSDIEKARNLLKAKPQLLLNRANIEDRASNRFIQITPFQYALWSLNWPMCHMMLEHFSSIKDGVAEAEQQFLKQPELTERQALGEHVDMNAIIRGYLYFIEFYRYLFKQACSHPEKPDAPTSPKAQQIYEGHYNREASRQKKSWANLMKSMNARQRKLPTWIIIATRYAQCDIKPKATTNISRWWNHLISEEQMIWLMDGKGKIKLASLDHIGTKECPEEMVATLEALRKMEGEITEQREIIGKKIAAESSAEETEAPLLSNTPK